MKGVTGNDIGVIPKYGPTDSGILGIDFANKQHVSNDVVPPLDNIRQSGFKTIH